MLAVLGLVVGAAVRQPAKGLKADSTTINDDGKFSSSQEGAESFAHISGFLRGEQKSCQKKAGQDPIKGAPCAARGIAGGYAQDYAVRSLHCTLPGVDEMRRNLREMLLSVKRLDADPKNAPPPPQPSPPNCS